MTNLMSFVVNTGTREGDQYEIARYQQYYQTHGVALAAHPQPQGGFLLTTVQAPQAAAGQNGHAGQAAYSASAAQPLNAPHANYGAPPQPHASANYGAPPQPHASANYGAPPQPHAGASYGAPPQPHPGASYGAPPQPHAGASYGAPPQPHAEASYGAPPQPSDPAAPAGGPIAPQPFVAVQATYGPMVEPPAFATQPGFGAPEQYESAAVGGYVAPQPVAAAPNAQAAPPAQPPAAVPAAWAPAPQQPAPAASPAWASPPAQPAAAAPAAWAPAQPQPQPVPPQAAWAPPPQDASVAPAYGAGFAGAVGVAPGAAPGAAFDKPARRHGIGAAFTNLSWLQKLKFVGTAVVVLGLAGWSFFLMRQAQSNIVLFENSLDVPGELNVGGKSYGSIAPRQALRLELDSGNHEVSFTANGTKLDGGTLTVPKGNNTIGYRAVYNIGGKKGLAVVTKYYGGSFEDRVAPVAEGTRVVEVPGAQALDRIDDSFPDTITVPKHASFGTVVRVCHIDEAKGTVGCPGW